jgi:hypothetical protein
MDASEIIATYNRWDADRANHKALVQQVMEYGLPQRATVTVTRTPGEDLHRELFDSTAETAVGRGASGLYGAMCPSDRAWFLLTPPIEFGRLAGEFGRSMLGVSEQMRDQMARSNFAEAAYKAFLDLMTAGRCVMEPARGRRSVLRYTTYPYEQCVFSVDGEDRPDAVLRRFSWTTRQLVAEFGRGEAAVGKAISDAYEQEGGRGRDKKFEVIHAAVPRSEFTPGRWDVRDMPLASTWVAVQDKHVLRESGWPQLRYLVCRWMVASGEQEGRAPLMTCLPDVKMVNKIEEAVIVGAEGLVRPSILAPAQSLVANGVDGAGKPAVVVKPGSIIWYRPNAAHPGLKPEPFNTGARPDLGIEYADSKRQIIRAACFNDLFMVLLDQDRQKTATEVRAILHDQMRLLGPQFGQMKVELFDALIRVNLAIFAEVPELLGGLPLGLLNLANIRYTSTLALAMEYAEMMAMQDAMIFLSPFAEIAPEIWDNFSFDEISRGIAEKMALPPRWLKPRDEVRAIREKRMQYQAAQLQQQMAFQQAAEFGKLTKRPEPGSPAAALAEAA